jgi:hypothetical protein
MNPEIIKSLLDRPVAFHRCFAHLTGNVTSALMLSQAIYWTNRTKNSEGWFWKSREEWFDEIALTRREQETARKRLKGTGFWKEREDKFAHKLFYRVDLDALIRQLSGLFAQGRKAPFAEGGNELPAEGGKRPSRMTETALPSTSETTSQRLPETTAGNIPSQEAKAITIPQGAILPNGNDPWKAIKVELRDKLNPQSWDTWIRPTRLAYTLAGKLFVAVPSAEFAGWIEDNFGPTIEAARQTLKLEFGGIEFLDPLSGA